MWNNDVVVRLGWETVKRWARWRCAVHWVEQTWLQTRSVCSSTQFSPPCCPPSSSLLPLPSTTPWFASYSFYFQSHRSGRYLPSFLSLRFKVRHHRIEGARKSLRRLRGAGYPGLEVELEEMQQCCKDEKDQGNSSVWDEIQSRTFVIPMSIFTLIFILLGCTGNDTMVFLGPSIFSEVIKMSLKSKTVFINAVSLGHSHFSLFIKVDIGLPAEVLTILPWIGFSLGYAISTPVMAKMNRLEDCCQNKWPHNCHIFILVHQK